MAEQKSTQHEVVLRFVKILVIPLNKLFEEFRSVKYAPSPKSHRILYNDFVFENEILSFDDLGDKREQMTTKLIEIGICENFSGKSFSHEQFESEIGGLCG